MAPATDDKYFGQMNDPRGPAHVKGLKIRLLADGRTKWDRFRKRWGLSILIDDDILFDTFGLPDYVIRRMARFHVDPDRLRSIVLSHDDWDHVSGLRTLLGANRDVAVYLCPHASPVLKRLAGAYATAVVEAEKPVEIRPHVFVSGEIAGGSRGGVPLPEQYLALKTPTGLVVITGCAHPGIVAITRHAKANFGGEIRLLAGGFHLKDNDDAANRAIIRELQALGVRQVMPLHCTGQAACRLFRHAYGADCLMPDTGKCPIILDDN